MGNRKSLTRYAWLSIAAAVATIGLKTSAYLLTGSVGLLSDALESFVNLAAAVVALGALTIAARPPDSEHEFGHDKIEYFSSGVEGTLIFIAAASIALTSVERLLHPQPLQEIGLGVLASGLASAINFGVAHLLIRASKQHHSITLEADAHHLMSDVWSSVAVIAGVLIVYVTGIGWLDPIIALAVAAQIFRAGIRLMRKSANGLMDVAIVPGDRMSLEAVLAPYQRMGIEFHALRTRQSGARQFVTVHVLVPGHWSVQQGHNLLEQIEADIRAALPLAHITTHLEPQGDVAAMADAELDRQPV
jgi:cation diffusion facilitator family transporter